MITLDKRQDMIKGLRQQTLTEYIEAKTAQMHATVHEVRELPLSFKSGTIFTFSKIESTKFTHAMHSYPAKFVPQIPSWAIRYAKLNVDETVLDPFCGCGTTLVEARIAGINSYGIDMNPIARLITRVKATPLYLGKPELIYVAAKKLMEQIQNDHSEVELRDQPDVNLHYNWRFWFSEDVMKQLIKIKRNIRSFDPPNVKEETESMAIRDFFLVCLSSIIKRVSYLDEDQIKVRRSLLKMKQGVPSPLQAFNAAVQKNLRRMWYFTRKCSRYPKAIAKVIGDDARSIRLPDSSVDLIVTSPPYINAIDYPFAHKHELFILDLVKPEEYRPHSRNYIGVSERVLLKSMYADLHLTGYGPVDEYIIKIYNGGRDVDKNRAYIVYQYFCGMQAFLKEAARVLKDKKLLVIFVGDNRIRNIYIPTHCLLMKIAEDKFGFEAETFFYHQMKLKKLAMPRNKTGGEIEKEMAIVLRKR
jgi:DNA modification methylase